MSERRGGGVRLGGYMRRGSKIENHENHLENYTFCLVIFFRKRCYGLYRGNKEHQLCMCKSREISSDRVPKTVGNDKQSP